MWNKATLETIFQKWNSNFAMVKGRKEKQKLIFKHAVPVLTPFHNVCHILQQYFAMYSQLTFCLSAFSPWNRSFHAWDSHHIHFRFLCLSVSCVLCGPGTWHVCLLSWMEWSCCHVVYGIRILLCVFGFPEGARKEPHQCKRMLQRAAMSGAACQHKYDIYSWCFVFWDVFFRFLVEFVCWSPDWGWCCRTTPRGGSTFAFWRRVLHLVLLSPAG